MSALYDRIGTGYSAARRPDPRLADAIRAALGDVSTVVNVGAGTGNYEPADCEVTAVEPSTEMIAQRRPDAGKAVQASAEALPFPDDSFGAAMAVLTVHHWSDQAAGLRELRRVARGPVMIATFDPDHPGTWLTDYLPQLRALDAEVMPPLGFYGEHLGEVVFIPLPIPHDCSDGFLYSYWRRPEAYLDPRIRAGSSSFHLLDDLGTGLARLAADLESGAWEDRYGHLRELDEIDAGYRLVRTI
ncbi:methyltransferase domain-containing protein [Altererythrobacter salegens]|uniref:Methyltransferase domain-containing protein n=1 Tax=Croceibacterium salegens TaxID=1737568 RepID=A0A6I4SUM7_9SPHN|nr:methyltransferase domain-containing protein [Croceibacterium salegens]